MAIYEIETDTTLYQVAAALLLFLLALIIVITVSSYLIGEKWNNNHSVHIPESGVTMLIGIMFGGILRLSSYNSDTSIEHNLVAFSPPLFFLGFLPPIIFNEGHHLDKSLFFAHLTPIAVFAFLGTAISTVIVAGFLRLNGAVGIDTEVSFAEAGTFGAMISATDPVAVLAAFSSLRVEPTLFFIVFGESVLNDAVSLTMFAIASQFVGEDVGSSAIAIGVFDFIVIMVGSSITGWLCGVGMALALKTASMHQTRVLELALYATLIYVPYMFAQVLGMSGIVSILVAGIAARHYAYRNLSSDDERDLADFLFRLASFLTDNATFLYLGTAVFGVHVSHDFKIDFIMWAFFACLVSRAVAVFGLSAIINSTSRWTGMGRLGWQTQVVIWFSGLRGAVAFAAATVFPDKLGSRNLFITTTMAIIIIFTFIIAPWTVPILRLLKIPIGVDYRSVRVPKLNRVYKWVGDMDSKYVATMTRRKSAASATEDVTGNGGVAPNHPPRRSRQVPHDVTMAALRAAMDRQAPYQPDLPVSAFEEAGENEEDADETRTVHAGDVGNVKEPPNTRPPARSGRVSGRVSFRESAAAIFGTNSLPGNLSVDTSVAGDTVERWIQESVYDFGGPVSPRQPSVSDLVSQASRHQSVDSARSDLRS